MATVHKHIHIHVLVYALVYVHVRVHPHIHVHVHVHIEDGSGGGPTVDGSTLSGLHRLAGERGADGLDEYTRDVLEFCRVFDEEFEAFKQGKAAAAAGRAGGGVR